MTLGIGVKKHTQKHFFRHWKLDFGLRDRTTPVATNTILRYTSF